MVSVRCRVGLAVLLALPLAFTLPVSAAAQDRVRVQAVIDHLSELVITDQGVYWHNLNHAKPGNYGADYSTPGPTYIDGQEWMPVWGIPGEPRVEDTSDVYLIDTTGYAGFAPSQQYDGYFDSYLQLVGGEWVPLGSLLDINRGTFTASTYNGHPAIRIYDPDPGHMVYTFDVLLPEPATLALLAAGVAALTIRRCKR